MFKELVFYFQLAVLCVRLVWNLGVFSLKVLLSKIESKAPLNLVLFTLILLSIATSFYVLQKKSTPQIEIAALPESEKVGYQGQETSVVEMDGLEINNLKNYYENLYQSGVQSLPLLLNLNQLNLAIQNKELAQDYLKQAQQILPTINY